VQIDEYNKQAVEVLLTDADLALALTGLEDVRGNKEIVESTIVSACRKLHRLGEGQQTAHHVGRGFDRVPEKTGSPKCLSPLLRRLHIPSRHLVDLSGSLAHGNSLGAGIPHVV
jgi:hypothetical protein